MKMFVRIELKETVEIMDRKRNLEWNIGHGGVDIFDYPTVYSVVSVILFGRIKCSSCR